MNENVELMKIVADGMRSFAKRIDEVGDKMRSLALSVGVEPGETETPLPVVVRRRRAGKPATEKEATAKNMVLDLIGRKRKGTDIYELKQKTGFDDKKIYNLIYILKREGKIRSLRRGVFVKS